MNIYHVYKVFSKKHKELIVSCNTRNEALRFEKALNNSSLRTNWVAEILTEIISGKCK